MRDIVLNDVSRYMGTNTGSDMGISPHISPQIELFAKCDLQGLSTVIWTYHTGHIVMYWANITID